jgi:hypothetical protein
MADEPTAEHVGLGTPAIDADEKWRKLRTWLHEKVGELQGGDLDRLPQSLGGPATEVSLLAFETVLVAMDLIDAGKA